MLCFRAILKALATAILLLATSPPLLAQGLGEYGAAAGSSGAAASLASTLTAVEYSVRNAEPQTWVIVGVSALFLWSVLVRKR